MSFRLVTLNDAMALTLRYFNEFGKPASQLINRLLEHETFDQKSASV